MIPRFFKSFILGNIFIILTNLFETFTRFFSENIGCNRRNTTYSPGLMARMVDDCYPHFNQEQKQAFHKVLDSVNNDKGKIFFLHSAGGCGKTYICNTIAAAVHAQGKVVLCVASSAIAALLLDGG